MGVELVVMANMHGFTFVHVESPLPSLRPLGQSRRLLVGGSIKMILSRLRLTFVSSANRWIMLLMSKDTTLWDAT